MRYIYYIDGEKFTTDVYDEIPRWVISSFDDITPAFETSSGFKVWCEKGHIRHRLTGPAVIYADETVQFWLSGYYYENVKDWLVKHPNQDNTFKVEMLLKYS